MMPDGFLIEKLAPALGGLFGGLVIVLAKMDNKVSVLEEKVKTLFELWNKK